MVVSVVRQEIIFKVLRDEKGRYELKRRKKKVRANAHLNNVKYFNLLWINVCVRSEYSCYLFKIKIC